LVPEVAIQAALLRLEGDGLVAFPTETVWGLAALARSHAALEALRAWKGRDTDQPISLLVPDAQSLEALGFEVPLRAREWMDRHWPGPLTLVMPCRGVFAGGVSRGDGAVGVRCSSHPAAAELARAALDAGLGPITATSLNASGEAPARSRAEAHSFCAERRARGEVALYACDRDAGGAEPSTVVDVCGAEPQLLRVGALAPRTLGFDAPAEPR